MLAHRDAVWGGRQPSHLYLSDRRGGPFLTALAQRVGDGDLLSGDRVKMTHHEGPEDCPGPPCRGLGDRDPTTVGLIRKAADIGWEPTGPGPDHGRCGGAVLHTG